MGMFFVVFCSAVIVTVVLFFTLVLKWTLWISIVVGIILGFIPGMIISGLLVALFFQLIKKDSPSVNLIEDIIIPTMITSVIICMLIPTFQQAKRKSERQSQLNRLKVRQTPSSLAPTKSEKGEGKGVGGMGATAISRTR